MPSVKEESAQAIEQISQAVGEAIENEDVDELKLDLPEEPHAPWLMFGAALFKDLLDALDITGVGAVIVAITSFVFALVIFVWLFGKINWYQKGLVRWMIRRYAIVVVLEFIPGVQIIPTWSLYVLFAHNREKKLVKLIWGALGDRSSQLKKAA